MSIQFLCFRARRQVLASSPRPLLPLWIPSDPLTFQPAALYVHHHQHLLPGTIYTPSSILVSKSNQPRQPSVEGLPSLSETLYPSLSLTHSIPFAPSYCLSPSPEKWVSESILMPHLLLGFSRRAKGKAEKKLFKPKGRLGGTLENYASLYRNVGESKKKCIILQNACLLDISMVFIKCI